MIYTECGSRLSFQSWDTNIATNWEECKVHSWSTPVTISKKYLASCCFYRGKEWYFWNKIVCCQTWASCYCWYQWRCQKWTPRQYHNGNFACLRTCCREDLSIYWYLMSQFKAQSRTTRNYYFTLRDVFDKKDFLNPWMSLWPAVLTKLKPQKRVQAVPEGFWLRVSWCSPDRL